MNIYSRRKTHECCAKILSMIIQVGDRIEMAENRLQDYSPFSVEYYFTTPEKLKLRVIELKYIGKRLEIYYYKKMEKLAIYKD